MRYVESIADLLDIESETCACINELIRKINDLENRSDYCGNPPIENLKESVEQNKTNLNAIRKKIYCLLHSAY